MISTPGARGQPAPLADELPTTHEHGQHASVLAVLAQRYASAELVRLWSPEHKVVLERQLWLAVLRAQADLGVPVEPRVLDDYQRVVHVVDLESIAARERLSRHDVKARIEEFIALAGHQEIH